MREPPVNSVNWDESASSFSQSDWSMTNRSVVAVDFIPATPSIDKLEKSIDEEYKCAPARKNSTVSENNDN